MRWTLKGATLSGQTSPFESARYARPRAWRCVEIAGARFPRSIRVDPGRANVRQKSDEGREFVSTRSRELRSQAEDAIDKAKDVVAKQKDQLSAALEAGKQAYHEEKKTR